MMDRTNLVNGQQFCINGVKLTAPFRVFPGKLSVIGVVLSLGVKNYWGY